MDWSSRPWYFNSIHSSLGIWWFFLHDFCNLPLSNFFIRATFGLTANLPLICLKKKKSDSTLVTLKWPGAFFKIFFTPSPAVVFSIFVHFSAFLQDLRGIQQFWEQPWKFACTFKAQFNTVGKVLQFFTICVKVVLLAISANFCKKDQEIPTHFGGGGIWSLI